LGLGNEFLSHIREVDMIWHVLRCFPKEEVIHVESSVNPIRDYEIIQLELVLADLQQTKKRLAKLKAHDEKTRKEKDVLQLIQENLEKEKLVSQLDLSKEEKEIIKNYNFLTNKPFLLLANYGGEENEIKGLKEYAEKKGLPIFLLAIEKEMEELSVEAKEEEDWQSANFSLLAEGVKESLNFKTFFTVGEDETKS
jgi:ribosome-binding ATPase YchF (GTP1/OBG family)